MRRRNYMAAAGVLAVLVLGACSHSSGGQSSAPAHAVGAQARGTDLGTGLSAPDSARLPAASGAGGSAGSGSTMGTDTKSSAALVQAAKIRIASLTVAIKGAANVARQADAADAIATAAGGEVDADDRTSGRHARADLELRVPPETLQTTLGKLAGLGAERYRKLSTTDVTQQVADVHSRVLSAADSIARLQTLFHTAQKVRDVIAIESELSSRQAELESLQARERALSGQTQLATINLSLVTAAKKAAVPPKPAKHHGGFVGGVVRGWHGFVAAAVWIASAVGTVLPFLALLAVLALAARRFGWVPAVPHRRAAPAPSEPLSG